ncbi:hypothetical protein F6B41_23105 [Microbacterium lushaniae]|nr:hypothetical protein F6B41_23105 [Microbacterium lushaniae]
MAQELDHPQPLDPAVKGPVYSPPVVVAQRERARDHLPPLEHEKLLGESLHLRFQALCDAALDELYVAWEPKRRHMQCVLVVLRYLERVAQRQYPRPSHAVEPGGWLHMSRGCSAMQRLK